MYSLEFEKNVLLDLKRLNDKLDRLAEWVDHYQRYLEEMLCCEALRLPTRGLPIYPIVNKGGLT